MTEVAGKIPAEKESCFTLLSENKWKITAEPENGFTTANDSR